MSASNGWTCDGTPKNGREYDGLGGLHAPHTNYTSDCDLCGLPYESSDRYVREHSNKGIPKPAIIGAIAAGAILLIGGGAVYTFAFKSCPQGMQKMEGECADPYQQTYQESVDNGDKAISMAKSFQKSMETLTKAEGMLSNAMTQLSHIPDDALVYSEAKEKLELYDREKAKLKTTIQQEKKAEQQLTEAKAIATEAKQQSNQTTSSQLSQAKEKWQQAIDKLEAVTKGTLAANQVPKYKSDYQKEIARIEQKIASLIIPSRSQKAAYIPSEIPKSVPVIQRPQIPITPKPSQKCAVEPRPDYCRF